MAQRPRFTYRSREPEDWRKHASGKRESFIIPEINMYMVREGENYIRIMPPTWDIDPKTGESRARHFAYIIYVHYSVGPSRTHILCPFRMHGKPCPLCQGWAAADRAGDDTLKKELSVKEMFLIYLVDLKDKPKGVQAWAMPPTANQLICGAAEDPDQGGSVLELDHPDAGYNISVTTKNEGGDKRQRKYTAASVSHRPSSIQDDWLKFVQDYPLPEILIFMEYDDIKEVYEGPGSGERGEAEEEFRRPASPAGRTSRPVYEDEAGAQASSERQRPRSSTRYADEDTVYEGEVEEPPARPSRPAPRRSAEPDYEEPPPEERWGDSEPTRGVAPMRRRSTALPMQEPEDDRPPRTPERGRVGTNGTGQSDVRARLQARYAERQQPPARR